MPKKWKVRSIKKLSVGERRKLMPQELPAKDLALVKCCKGGEQWALRRRELVEVICDSSCRHGRDMGVPCVDFNALAKGVCKRDSCLCDLLNAKGEKFLREYEGGE